MSEHIMENLTIRPLNDVSEKLSKRANEHEIRNGTLSALTERCNRLEVENAKLLQLLQDLAICACGKYCYGCPHQYDGCNRDQRLRELGIDADDEDGYEVEDD